MRLRDFRIARLEAVGYSAMVPNLRFNPWRAVRAAERRWQRGLIGPRAFLTYQMLIQWKGRQHDRVLIAYTRLAGLIDSAKGTAVEAVKQLEAAGLLLVVPQRVKNAWASRVTENAYILLEPPPLPERPRRLPEFGAVLPALAKRARAAVATESNNRTARESVQNQPTAPLAPVKQSPLEAMLARLGAAVAAREAEKGAQGVAEGPAASLRAGDG